MSQHDETPSVESEQSEETPAEEVTHEEADAQESAPDTSAPEENVKEEESSDDLFLDPDESEGEEVDLDAGPNLQEELDAERARVAKLTESLESMTTERDDFKSRLLRTAADMENFRKRKDRERDEMKKYGADKVVSDMLPAIDNLERALEHAEKSEETSSIADGVKMVHRQLQTALEKHGIKGFTAVGEKFDPQLHEAIQQIETTEHETGVVMQEFQKGYYIHDRLLRPAMTVVAKNVAPPKPEVVVEEEEPATEESTEQEAPVMDMGDASLEEGSESGS